MKQLKFLFTVLFLAVLGLGNAWAETATMAAGTNGSTAKVGGADAIKVGTSKAGGNMTITVGAGATKLEFYAAAWKGVSDLSLNITPAANVDGSASVALTADAGIANNSPFTLTGNAENYKFSIDLKNVTAETTLTFTSSAAKRFVVWGATYTTGGGTADPFVVTLKDDNSTLTEASAGAGVTLPSRTTTCTDYAFVGWSETNCATETTTAPTIIEVGEYKPSKNVELYPVFKKTVGDATPLTATVNIATYATANNWISGSNSGPQYKSITLDENITISTTGTGNSGKYYSDWRLYQSGNGNAIVTAANGYSLKSVKFTYTNSNGGQLSYGSTVAAVGNTPSTVTVSGSSAEFKVTNSGSATNGQARVTAIEVKYTAAAQDYYIAAPTCVAAPELIAIGVTGTPAEFWKGDAFNYDGITVTALWDDESETNVTAKCAFTGYDMSAAGAQTVTVTYQGETATYGITVKTIANTQATAYTVAEAIGLIDAGKDLATQVYVKGTVSKIVEAWSTQYNNITYSISDDGETTSAQFQLFRCVTNNIAEGGAVIALGTLTKYGSTYEFEAGNSVVAYTAPVVERTTATISGFAKYTMASDDADDVYEITYNGDGELSVLSSNIAVATIALEGTTVTVHPVAAGTTKITISAPQTDAYTSATKTYTLTVNPAFVAAALPFSFDGGRGDMNEANGIKHTGLGTDYSASPKLKFDGAGDVVVIRIAAAAKKVEYTIKGNGYTAGQFDVLQSADGETYSALKSHTDDIPGTATKVTTDKPAADTRYIKFIYTTKNAGNVALGNIKITAASVLDPAELAFEKETYSFLTTSEKKVEASSAAGSDGAITYSCEDANLTIDAATGVITCTTAGTYTINAAIAATGDYMAGNASCTVKVVEPAVANSIIVAEVDGKVYAMTNTVNNSYVVSVEIYKYGEKYVVSEENYENVLFNTTTVDNQVSIVRLDNQYLQATGAKNVSFTETEYHWTLDEGKLTAANTANGTLQYNTGSPRFTTYTSKVGQYAQIVSLENVIIGDEIYTRELNDKMGTHCYPFTIKAGEYTGAHFYVPAYREGDVKIFWDEVAADEDIEAGRPYLVVPAEEGAKLEAVVNNVEGADAQTINGFVGSYEQVKLAANAGNYVVYNNQFRLAGANVAVGANRAYIVLANVDDNEVAPAPGRRRIVLNNASVENATALENITEEFGAEQVAKKVVINGTIYIVRGAEVYTVEGQLVK